MNNKPILTETSPDWPVFLNALDEKMVSVWGPEQRIEIACRCQHAHSLPQTRSILISPHWGLAGKYAVARTIADLRQRYPCDCAIAFLDESATESAVSCSCGCDDDPTRCEHVNGKAPDVIA